MIKNNSYQARVMAKKANLRQFFKVLGSQPVSTIGSNTNFDNQPTWDNWPDKGGAPFDNQPTWDNWPNKK